MTEQQFWEMIQQNLDLPFDIEDVVEIEPDLLGAVHVDTKDGETYILSFITEFEDDDDE